MADETRPGGAASGDLVRDLDGADAAVIDGRSARRDRNLESVLDATIALIAEGNLTPTTAEVADRCELSQRSVNRYFGDVHVMQQAAAERAVIRGTPRFKIHAIGRGPRDRRVREFVEVRVRAQVEMGPTARAAKQYEQTRTYIREQMEGVRLLLCDQVELQFAPELAALGPQVRAATVLAIDTLFQFESLDHNLNERALPADELTDLLCIAVDQLLSAAGDSTSG